MSADWCALLALGAVVVVLARDLHLGDRRRTYRSTVVATAAAATLAATTLSTLEAPALLVLAGSALAAAPVLVTAGGHRALFGRTPCPVPALAAAVLSELGVLTTIRLAPSSGVSQAVGVAIGVAVLLLTTGLAAAARGIRGVESTVATAGALTMFALPLVPGVGNAVGGAAVGVSVGGVSVQLSEIARPVLAAVVAARTASIAGLVRHSVRPGRHLAGAAAPLAVATVLLVLADDRGPLLVLGLTAVLLALRIGPPPRVVAVLLGAPLVLGGLAALSSTTLRRRVSDMASPSSEEGLTNLGAGLRSFARGGWTGTGVGRGDPDAVRFVESDFVLTHLAEERGALAALLVLALLALVVRGGWLLAGRIGDPGRRAVAEAMVLLLVVQTLYTTAGVLALVPLTGMPLPFLSRGGSSIVGAWLTLALLLGPAARRDLAVGARPRGPGVAGRVTDAAFAAVALALVVVVLAPPVAAGARVDADWARRRGLILAADGDVLARSTADGTGREYPQGRTFSDVVGFTSIGAGAGLELTERGRLGCDPSWWEDLTDTPCRPPSVVSTIMPAAQRAAWSALDGQRGDVVALTVGDGAVLAAASSDRPEVDGPGYAALASSPGSVFKLVTAAAALENGVVTETPRRVEYVAPGGSRPVHNAGGGPGGGTLEEALAASSNTAFGEIATRVGGRSLTDTGGRLLGRTGPRSGSDPSDLSRPTDSTVGVLPTAPDALTRTGFGQEGVRTTPLSLAVLAATLANGGSRPNPRAVAGTCRDGRFRPDPDDVGVRVLDAAVAARLAGAMAGVVDAGAVPALVDIPGGAAAKTGTAQRPDGATDGLVVAFAPRAAPRVAVAVRVEGRPGAERSGGRDAGPIAATVLRAALSAVPDGSGVCAAAEG